MPPSSPIVITEDDDDDERQRAPAGQDTAAAAAAADCPICYEPYSDGGDHRPAALRCGHVAGKQCLRTWLRSSKACPNCRKPAKLKDLVPLFNLPTLVAAGSGAAPATAAAAAAGANPSELAQKEMLLQKVQRAYNQKEKEAQQQAEEARRQKENAQRQAEDAARQAREKKRLAEEALAKDQENKRLRLQLEDMQRRLDVMKQSGAAAAMSAGCGGSGANPVPHRNAGNGGGGEDAGGVPTAGNGAAPHRGSTVSGTGYPGLPHGPGGAPWAAGPATQQQQPLPALPAGSMWGQFSGTQHAAAPFPGHSQIAGGFPPQHQPQPFVHHDGARGVYGSRMQRPPPPPGFNAGGGGSAFAGAAAGYGCGGGDGSLFSRVFSVAVEGCRLLALDVAGARLLASEVQNSAGGSGSSLIRKISLHAPECSTRIRLPANAGIVYDMQLPPGSAAGRHFLAVATQGALCLACPRSDTVVATFSGLPYRAWSCSWVPQGAGAGQYGEHLLLAGMDKGHLALLDTRRIDRPVAVLAALQHQAASGCAQLPVRTVAVLPDGPMTQGSVLAAGADPAAAATAGGGALWPSCAVSCSKGAWLMVGGGGAGTAADDGGAMAAAPPAPPLLRLDGGFGGGSMQLESLAVLLPADGGTGGGIGGGTEGLPAGQPSWRAALSWRPAGSGGGVGAQAAAAVGPRHEIGLLRACDRVPYKHEFTVTDYTRRGLQAVRSCLVPGLTGSGGGSSEGEGGLLLVSGDDDCRQPLIWSLGASAAGSGGGGGGAYGAGGGGGGWRGGPQVVQRLEPHPDLPTCMVAAGGGGGGAGCFLACGSSSRVVVYRRRGG